MERIIPIWKNGKLSSESKNKTFCMAPWTHTYISPQSERRLCCASREEHTFQKQYIDSTNDETYGETSESNPDAYNPVTLKEHWNSDYMKDIRVKLMAGEEIPQCDVCNKSILSLNTYRSWFTGFLFTNKIQEVFDKTDDDGHTEMEVISFDYRFNNVCNFKCRMCGEQLSSTWEHEKRKHDMWSPERDPWMVMDMRSKIMDFQKNVVEAEFQRAIDKGIVEEIYWVGGEPLLFDIHWTAMEQLVDENNADKCYVRYNTNLSKIQNGDTNLFLDILPHYKDWLICASIDATGKIGEFIRTGLKWNQWLNNYLFGCELDRNKMRIDLTLTGPGMFDLENIVDLSISTKTRIETKIVFAFHPDVVLSPFAWPRHILDKVLDDNIKMVKSKPNQYLFNSLLNTLVDMKNRPTFEEQWPDTFEQALKNGKHYQTRIKTIRHDGDNGTLTLEDIYANNTELLEWWNKI
jgi:hypothetical protein